MGEVLQVEGNPVLGARSRSNCGRHSAAPPAPDPAPLPRQEGYGLGQRVQIAEGEERAALTTGPGPPTGGLPRGPRGVGKRAGAQGQGEGTASAHMLLNRKRSSQVKARSVVMMMVITTMTGEGDADDAAPEALPRQRATSATERRKTKRPAPTQPRPASQNRPAPAPQNRPDLARAGGLPQRAVPGRGGARSLTECGGRAAGAAEPARSGAGPSGAAVPGVL